MGLQARSYQGRIYHFRVTGIDGVVVYLQNIETFSNTMVNKNFVSCEDGKIMVGDYITRQYSSGGLGYYSGGTGGMSIVGETNYMNQTSSERHKKNDKSMYILKRFFSLGNVLLFSVLGIFGVVGLIIYGVIALGFVLSVIFA